MATKYDGTLRPDSATSEITRSGQRPWKMAARVPARTPRPRPITAEAAARIAVFCHAAEQVGDVAAAEGRIAEVAVRQVAQPLI